MKTGNWQVSVLKSYHIFLSNLAIYSIKARVGTSLYRQLTVICLNLGNDIYVTFSVFSQIKSSPWPCSHLRRKRAGGVSPERVMGTRVVSPTVWRGGRKDLCFWPSVLALSLSCIHTWLSLLCVLWRSGCRWTSLGMLLSLSWLIVFLSALKCFLVVTSYSVSWCC